MTIKCVSLLFMLFALADASILQVYAGNHSVGIPPAHHFSAHHDDGGEFEHSSPDRDDDSQHSDDQSDEDYHEHLSFSSTYIIAQTFLFEPNLVFSEEKITNSVNSYHSKYSNSAVTNLFRPPRIA